MLAKQMTRWVLIVSLAAVGVALVSNVRAVAGGNDQVRKVRVRVQPTYPDLARRMNLAGTVKCEVVVGSNGSAKTIKPVGGNPVLIEAATDALKKWRWEPGEESTELVEFHFSRDEQ